MQCSLFFYSYLEQYISVCENEDGKLVISTLSSHTLANYSAIYLKGFEPPEFPSPPRSSPENQYYNDQNEVVMRLLWNELFFSCEL